MTSAPATPVRRRPVFSQFPIYVMPDVEPEVEDMPGDTPDYPICLDADDLIGVVVFPPFFCPFFF